MVRQVINSPRNSYLAIRSVTLAILLACSWQVASATANVTQLQAKAERGSVKEEIALAAAYYTGEGVPKDEKLAAYWYQKAAESGNPEAQNLVGYFYEAGIGVPADAARAVHWYQLSASSGFADAKLNLGVLYILGLGVEKNELRAAEYFQQAVDKGNGTAATYLGTIYYFGIGVKPDKAAAEGWYVVGQRLHDPMSAYNLGSLYSTAADHPHDFSRAAALLRQSAEAGYVPAMHSLALILVHHPELARSQEEALHLLETAANAGYWRSSLTLGVLARDGDGVPMDSKAAYYHFQVAILQGGATVQSMLRYDTHKLGAKLGTEQSEAIDSDANLWFQQHPLAFPFVNKNSYKGKLFPVPAHADPGDLLHASLPLSDPAS
jgi:uncharacterized protein